MGILIILLLVVLLSILFYFLFKLTKWVFKSKTRITWAISLAGFIVICLVIHKMFFEKMEFIQSEVYPDLFLIKHPSKNQNSLHKFIANKVVQEMNKENIGIDDSFSSTNRDTIETNGAVDNTLLFYRYTTAWGFNNGTVHFIENKEDPGGFSSEVLNNYEDDQLAYFSFRYCENDSSQYFGNLRFFIDGNPVDNEIVINKCR